jgi:hypothetical protein
MSLKKAQDFAATLCPWMRSFQADIVLILRTMPEETTLAQARKHPGIEEILESYNDCTT